MIKCLSSKLIHENEYMRVYDNLIIQDSRKKIYSTVERPDTVAIIAFNKSQKIIFQEILRFPSNTQSWELPMGGIDRDESIVDAACREFKEETGLMVDKIRQIGWFCPNPGLSTQKVNILGAKCSVDDNFFLSSKNILGEGILRHSLFTQSEIKNLIKCGHITDGFTLACLAYLPFLVE